MNNSGISGDPQQMPKGSKSRISGIWWGAGLVFVGIIFLLQNIGALNQHFNWWAIFIFIPALSAFSGAGIAYERSGRIDAAVRSAVGGGLIILTVALMFLINLNWGLWWPLMVIMPGFAIFINGFPDKQSGDAFRGLIGFSVWCGAAMMLLGATFLANNLKLINLETLFGTFRWWGIFILIPGVGAIINGLVVFLKGGNRLTWASQALLMLGLVITAVAALVLLGLDWNLLGPIIVIAIGVGFLTSYLAHR